MKDILYVLSTLSFAYPVALAFPAVVLFFSRLSGPVTAAVNYPRTEFLSKISPSLRLRIRSPLLKFLTACSILCLSLAAARPQRVSVVEAQSEARNIMLSLDVSKSMEAQDFKSDSGETSRIEAVKSVVREFIAARHGDRIGVVVFGTAAYLLSPLTQDVNILLELVDRLQLGLAGDGTAIGDGLGLALKRVRELKQGSKAIILLTDGVSNSGQVNPLKAARMAKNLGIKVHTIGIGSNKPVTVRMPGDFFFQRSVQQVEFDEATLKKIAEITGGVYYNASDVAGLKRVYNEIDKLERQEDKAPQQRIAEELFMPFALIGLISYLVFLLLAKTIFLKVP